MAWAFGTQPNARTHTNALYIMYMMYPSFVHLPPLRAWIEQFEWRRATTATAVEAHKLHTKVRTIETTTATAAAMPKKYTTHTVAVKRTSQNE